MKHFTEDEFDDELMDDGDELREISIPIISNRMVRQRARKKNRDNNTPDRAGYDDGYDGGYDDGRYDDGYAGSSYEDNGYYDNGDGYGSRESQYSGNDYDSYEDPYYGEAPRDYEDDGYERSSSRSRDAGRRSSSSSGRSDRRSGSSGGRKRSSDRNSSGRSGSGNKRRKRRRSPLAPALLAFLLILVITGVAAGMRIAEKYRYSDERESITTQFPDLPDEAIVIMNGEVTEEKVLIKDSTLYFTLGQAHRLSGNTRLYKDGSGLLLYATPTSVISASPGDTADSSGNGGSDGKVITFDGDDGSTYVSAEYLRNFCYYSYKLYENPWRVSILTEDVTYPASRLHKDSHIRTSGDRKSPILADVSRNDKVKMVSEGEEGWVKVMTEDGVTGFIEEKDISSPMDETVSPDSDYTEPEYPSIHMSGTVNMGWLQVFGQSGEKLLAEYTANAKTLNVVSPTWMSVDGGEGAVTNNGTASFVEKAHGMGIQVWAMLDDFNSGTADTPAIMKSLDKRAIFISNVMAELQKTGADGLNLDFENVPEESGEDYVQLIRELSIACRQNGKVFSIDNYVPTDSTDHYDRKEQGKVADYVVIMGYDEHYSGSDTAGSVASIDFVRAGIQNTMDEVPADKIINAVPFYCRAWITTNGNLDNKAFPMAEAKEYAKNHGIEFTWDDSVCQYYGESQNGDTLYQMWLEDAESIEAKLSVMSAFGIAGVAEWCLHYETPDVWDVIGEYVNAPRL